MKYKSKLSTVVELGVGAAAIAVLLLAGCGGGGGGGGAAAAGTPMVITPALGQFASGATVRVKDKNGALIATGAVNASGVAAVTVPAGATAPLLIEAGINGDKYFDENPAAAGRDANGFVPISGVASTALRALVPDTTTTAIGVTALTEMSVGQIEAASGIAATPVADILAVNQTIGDTMGVADILQPPTPVTTATRLNTTSVAADRYALILAGLAHLAAAGKTALDVANDLRNDVKDGKFDGRIGATAATAFDPAKFIPPVLNASNTAIGTALTTALNNALSTATTQLALSGAAPTVDVANIDLAAYKAAIIAVQATAPVGAGQVTSAQSFPLHSGYNARVVNGYSANYTISGTCSGTESIVWSPLAAAGTWRELGWTVLGTVITYTITYTQCTAASSTTTGTRYYGMGSTVSGSIYPGPYLGSSFPGQYTVPTTPITIPASVRVGDTGMLGTANIYTDSTKAVLLGQYVFSYAVEPDTASTAIINTITKRYSSSVLIATEQERSRIASDGTLTPLSIDIQSNTSADHLILTADNSFLSFPLPANLYPQGAYTPAMINSVLDHRMSAVYSNLDGYILTFSGELFQATTTQYPATRQACYPKTGSSTWSLLLSSLYKGTSGVSSDNCLVNIALNYEAHPGYDYVAATGTSVMAAAGGKVVNNTIVTTGQNNTLCVPKGMNGINIKGCGGWGAVGIDHGNGYITQYLHLSSISVFPGQTVNEGQQIGLSGDVGVSGAPHLHFEVLKLRNGSGYTNDYQPGSYATVDPYGFDTSKGYPDYITTFNDNLPNVCLWKGGCKFQ